MKKQLLLTASLLGFSSLALAHPGHGLDTAYAGFMHPMTGWDHLLVMLAIGVWAAKLGGKSRWQLPLTFVSVMAFGAMLGASGIYFAGVETAIAASVMAMGVLLILRLPMSTSIQLGITAIFALFHGMAHGVEIQSTQSGAVIAAMLVATATLHGLGLCLGSQRNKVSRLLQFGLAGGMLLLGGASLIG